MIECYIGENAELFLLGMTLAALYEQPGAKVKLRVADWVDAPYCLALIVDGVKIAIDVWDHSDRWNGQLLQWCDVYAKRNISLRHCAPFQEKVIPFGLEWACHSRRSALAAIMAIAGTLPRASKSRLRDVYRYLATPHWKSFEYDPRQPVYETILFQTRVWEPADAPGDEGINEERVSLLLSLRSEFGSRVVGGIVPTPFARKHYPDLITDQPCRHPQYIRWARKPLVGIYFRGLFGAIAIKMAEFLAASKCIVSEPIVNELPYPLDHISTYNSNDGCLEACERLLSDKYLADQHRQQSWDYYRAHVSPGAYMTDLLRRAGARLAQQV